MYALKCFAAERLFIGAGPETANHSTSLPYVPGTMTLGAFATLWIRNNGLPNSGNAKRSEFVELFHGGVRWPALFPTNAVVLSNATQICKYKEKPGCEQWCNDTLHSEPKPICGVCCGPTEYGKGQILGVPMASVTRVGMERINGRERAKDGLLFSRDCIESGTELRGVIEGSHPWLDQIARSASTDLWFGGTRSVGGRCEASLTNASVRSDPLAHQDNSLVLVVRSPAILVTPGGRPTLDPDPTEIQAILNVNVKPLTHSVRSVTIAGWHAPSGLPRPSEIAAAPGSVFRFRLDARPQSESLAKLQSGALGLRRSEGFGEIVVNPAALTALPARPTQATSSASSSTITESVARIRSEFDDRRRERSIGSLLRSAAAEKRRDGQVDLAAFFDRATLRRRLYASQIEALKSALGVLSPADLAEVARLLELEEPT